MQNADVAALLDARSLNAGFIVVRPCPLSQKLYTAIRQMTTRRQRVDDQRALNAAVRTMKSKRQRRQNALRVQGLDRRRFASGVEYFEKSGRLFPRPDADVCRSPSLACPLVVHNNWIVGKEAKIYRFREHLMWLYDGDERYYTSETRNYLTYENPMPMMSDVTPTEVTETELAALRTAFIVGYLLDRVVILPRFHCTAAHVQCPLNSLVHIKTFDAACAGRYRENSFLRHPKVPASVKQEQISQPLIPPDDRTTTAHVTASKVKSLFSQISAKVLNLGSLQQVTVDFKHGSVDRTFIRKLGTAIRRSRYRQLH